MFLTPHGISRGAARGRRSERCDFWFSTIGGNIISFYASAKQGPQMDVYYDSELNQRSVNLCMLVHMGGVLTFRIIEPLLNKVFSCEVYHPIEAASPLLTIPGTPFFHKPIGVY